MIEKQWHTQLWLGTHTMICYLITLRADFILVHTELLKLLKFWGYYWLLLTSYFSYSSTLSLSNSQMLTHKAVSNGWLEEILSKRLRRKMVFRSRSWYQFTPPSSHVLRISGKCLKLYELFCCCTQAKPPKVKTLHIPIVHVIRYLNMFKVCLKNT